MKRREKGLISKVISWWTPVRVVGLVIGSVGVAASVFGAVYKGRFAYDIIQAFYPNVGTECVSIAVTITIIDWLYELRDEKREKERLVREIRNPDNGIALMVVEEIRARGWLDGGSILAGKYLWDANLKGANLVGVDLRRAYLNRVNFQGANLDEAKLEGAHLERADLRGARLDRANLDHCDMRNAVLADTRMIKACLQHAHLHGANLTGARLDDADLTGAQVRDEELFRADRLRGARMPDGARYDGRYNLSGDLAAAANHGFQGSTSDRMVAYYGISAEAYQRGQTWAEGKPQGQGI